MEDKESYTHKEVKEMFDSFRVYQKSERQYRLRNFSWHKCTKDEEKGYHEKLIESVEDCENKIPKSLINKLHIQKE